MTRAPGVSAAVADPAASRRVGTVSEVWRYPVKSMRGERCERARLTTSGVLGDRAWALREPATGRIASAKRFPRMLDFRATYTREPEPGRRGDVQIDMPGGGTLDPQEAGASAVM